MLERIKLTARVDGKHAHYIRYFPANGQTNPDVFCLKPSPYQGESSLKISGRWEQINKQTNTQTH